MSKKALVTSASRGLSCATALSLACVGTGVVITYERSADKAQAVVDEVKALGQHSEAVQAGSVNVQAIRETIAHMARSLTGLDTLISDTGIARDGPLEPIAPVDTNALVNANICGAVITTQEALVHMADGGRVINIGSCPADHVTMPDIVVYTMTKSAFNALVRGLICDLGPRGIAVSLVHPGPTNSGMNPGGGEQTEAQRQMTVIGHCGQPGDIAATVIFFASPTAGQISSTGLDVDSELNA